MLNKKTILELNQEEDLELAIYVEGEKQNTLPEKNNSDNYVFDKAICYVNGKEDTNVTVSWDSESWAPIVKGLSTYKTRCDLYFKKIPFNEVILACNESKNAAECLLENADLNPSELAYDETADNNLRYFGADPNNYISFNNEIWRIIGVMNNIDNGTGKKESRIKIIRDESIGHYEWDYTDAMGQNNWSKANLKDLLNTGAYYNRTTGKYGEAMQYTVDFTNTGLTNEAKTLIDNAVWNLGGFDSTNYNTPISYTKERGTEVSSGNSTTWVGKVGLIYPSDYGYATSGGSITSRENCLNIPLSDWKQSTSKDEWECGRNNWIMKGKNSLWTISHSLSFFTDVIAVSFTGQVISTSAYNPEMDIVPVTYLISDIRFKSGDGSSSNPFEIA